MGQSKASCDAHKKFKVYTSHLHADVVSSHHSRLTITILPRITPRTKPTTTSPAQQQKPYKKPIITSFKPTNKLSYSRV
jgi:hypothetical protein